MFKCRDPSPSQTIHALTCPWDAFFATTFVDRTGSLPSPSILDRMTLWSPPPNPVTKINVDASWKIGSSVAWVGLVIQDFGSRCLAVKELNLGSFGGMLLGTRVESCSGGD